MSGREESTPLGAQPSKGGKSNKKGDPKTTTPQTSSKKNPGIELTAVESLLFFNIVRFNTDPSAVDWYRVALHSNLKNAASAKVRFRQIQRKYHMDIGTPSGGIGGNCDRKRKPTGEEPEDDDDNSDETPSKKAPPRKRAAPGTGRGKKAAKKPTMKEADTKKEQEPDDYDEEDEENEEEEEEEEVVVVVEEDDDDEAYDEDGDDVVAQPQSQSRQRTANPEVTHQDDPFVKQEPRIQPTQSDPYSGIGWPFNESIGQQHRPQQLPFKFQPSPGMDQLHQIHQHYPMMQGMAYPPQHQQQQPLTNMASQPRTNVTPQQMASLRQQQLFLQQQRSQQLYQQQQRQQSTGFIDPFLGIHAVPHSQSQTTQTSSLQSRPEPRGLPQPQPEQDGAPAGLTGSPAGLASPAEVPAGAADDAAADHVEEEQQKDGAVVDVKHEE